MSEQRRNRVDRIAACAAVAVAHVVLFSAILRTPVVPQQREDALVVDFIHLPRPRASETTHRKSRSSVSRPAAPGVHAHAGAPNSRAQHDAPALPDAGTARSTDWNLSLPPAPVVPVQSAPALERRDALPVHATRFEQAWVPEGDALRQASFRSRAVGVALGAFGGPPRNCTEIERRLRKVNCLPLHAQNDDDEALRRKLDD